MLVHFNFFVPSTSYVESNLLMGQFFVPTTCTLYFIFFRLPVNDHTDMPSVFFCFCSVCYFVSLALIIVASIVKWIKRKLIRI